MTGRSDLLVLFQDAEGDWRWHRKAPNGEVISQGESHPNQQDAKRAALRANPDLSTVVTGE